MQMALFGPLTIYIVLKRQKLASVIIALILEYSYEFTNKDIRELGLNIRGFEPGFIREGKKSEIWLSF